MILVTGATGNVGAHVVRQLVKRDIAVRAGAHTSRVLPYTDEDGVEAVTVDFRDPATLVRAMDGVDHVFLLTPFSDGAREMAQAAIAAAQQAGVQHIVRLSALGADPQSPVQLLRWHGEIEEDIKASGLAYTMLRPNGFIDNLQTYMGEQLRTSGTVYLPLDEARVSYIAVRDIGEVAAIALSEPGYGAQVLNLTGSEALSMTEVFQVLTEVTGRTFSYVPVTEDAARQGFPGPKWMVDAMLGLYAYYRAGKGADVSPVVQVITGHAPMSLSTWVREHAREFTRAA